MTPESCSRRLFGGPCSFVLAATEPAHLASLPQGLPEVAFWGRSNVGKSSLLNALTGRKSLARTSSTPGRTRQIIFFDLGGQLLLADLPGYGYAKASKQEIAQWQGMIRYYLKTRAALRCVFLLIDGRHGIKEADEEQMAFLDTMAMNYQVILTKADKNEKGLAALAAEVEKKLKKHPAARPEVLTSRSDKPESLNALRDILLEMGLKE